MHCDIDIAVAGFLCPPSSVLNPGRWQPDYNPMQEKGAEVFYEVVECLRWYGVLGSIVKLVVLENVLLQRPATLVLLREGVEGGPNACSVECRKMTCHAFDFAVNAPIDYDRILKVQEPFRHGPWMLQARSPLPPPRHLHHRDVFWHATSPTHVALRF